LNTFPYAWGCNPGRAIEGCEENLIISYLPSFRGQSD
jgi:hypothetical protein